MSIALPHDLPIDALGALERAATALARVEVASEPGGTALSDALIRRKAVALAGGGEDSVRALLLGDSSAATKELREIAAALLENVPAEQGQPPLVRAALAYGEIVASPPVTRESLVAASLRSDAILTGGGLMTHCRLSPWQLDAGTRSAAVQLERSGAWLEWIRAWCIALAREASTIERSVRGVITELAAQRAVARQQHRIGATDELVLAQLQSAATFTIPDATRRLELTAPTVGTAIERLEAAG